MLGTFILTWFSKILALILTAKLTGCATDKSIHAPMFMLETVPQNIQALTLGGSKIAFGSVRWVENGKVRTRYASSLGWTIFPKFLQIENNDTGYLEVEEDGRFAWKLPQATYLINQLRWYDSWDGLHHIQPRIAFHLPENANAYCLGTLVVDIATKRDFIGLLLIKGFKITIEDSCEEEEQFFRSHYSDPEITTSKAVMIHSPFSSKPENPDKLLKFLHHLQLLLQAG